MISKFRIFLYLCFAITGLYILHKFLYENWNYYYKYQNIPVDLDNRNYKLILLWTSYQGKWTGWSGLTHDQIVKGCDNVMNGECIISSNKAYANSADVILFSMQDLKQEYISLKARSGVFPKVLWNTRIKQLWIAVWYEPNQILGKYHYYTKEYLNSLDNIFNGTITYRDDSIIKAGVYSGGCHYKKNSKIQDVTKVTESQSFLDAAANKSRLVSWVVSHCNTPSGRDHYVEKMKESITVDVYGHCGSLELDRGSEEETLSKYKFYLAFENSKCPSYVTEKLFKILNQNLSQIPPVPVVLGPNKSWYEDNLPRRSFIHVDEFQNPEQLAKYLDFLDRNSEEYTKYLNWRREYTNVCGSSLSCQLCQKLVASSFTSLETQSIQDFESFWKKAECEKPVENSDTEQSVFLILQRLYWSLGL